MKRISIIAVAISLAITAVPRTFAAGTTDANGVTTYKGDKWTLVTVVEDFMNSNWLKLIPFYTAYHLYIDMFCAVGLNTQLTTEQKSEAIRTVFLNLSKRSAVNVVIKRFFEGKDLAFAFALVDEKGALYLVMRTNYDLEKQALIVGESSGMKKTYSRTYLVKNRRIVPLEKTFSKEKENAYIEKGISNDLGSYYLFDELADNDSMVYEIVMKDITKSTNPLLRYISYMTLGELYLSQGKIVEAKAIVGECEKIEKKGKPEIFKDRLNELDIYRDEVALTEYLVRNN